MKGLIQYLLLIGAVIYACWTQGGPLAGIGAGIGLAFMLWAILRPRAEGRVIQEMRESVARRWTCKSCGTRAKPKSVACLNCGTNF